MLLLSLPWDKLEYPSIQLGILLSCLERAGIPAQSRSLGLDFVEHCLAATAGRPPGERLSVRSYAEVVRWSREVSVGDWIFSTAGTWPVADDADARYRAFAREFGVPDRVVDAAFRFRDLVPGFLDRVADELAAGRPALVGFTTAFNQTLASLALATELRRRLGDAVTIVFGGANCEGAMGAALHRAFPVVDVVVRGEGERVLPDLALDVLAGRPVRAQPGLCLRDADGNQVVVDEAPGLVPLDEVPLPRYDEYFDRLRRTGLAPSVGRDVAILYESARGCWWGERSHCTFCGISDRSLTFRAKSPARVRDELAELALRHGRLDFLFVDYILHRGYFRELLPQLRDAGVDLRLFAETKANLRRDEVLLLREAGFTTIQAGVESLSTPILALMRKGVTALQNVRLLKWCAEYGVRLRWNVLYGIPGEPPEEYDAMAALVPSLTHLEPPSLVPLQLDRFSPYFERPDEFGIVPLGPRSDFRHVYPADLVDDEALGELVYAFEFAHADGRDPEAYSSGLRREIARWRSTGRGAIGSLTYRCGPGFVTVSDRRPGLDPADYRLARTESCIYLACEDGATVAEACAAADASEEAVVRFLDCLVESRLVCRLDGRYLALALPYGGRGRARDGAAAPKGAPQRL